MMKPYPKYKDSGIEWLGEIPEHWNMAPLKHIAYMKGRIGWQGLKQAEFTDEGPYLITGMNFKNGRINWDECYHITEERYEEAPEIHLRNGDVLMTKDGTIGKLLYVGNLPDKASLNSHLLLIRPVSNEFHQKYLYYLLHSTYFWGHIEISKTGTTFYGITQEAMGLYKMLLPNREEQKAIASYLDRKTHQVDGLIEKKRRMIDLLKEQRAAIINHAVTKGLNPKAKMKDSGIEWLGEIPEHWKITPLKFLLKDGQEGIKIGPFGSALKLDIMKSDGYKVYGQENIINDDFNVGKRYIDADKFSEMSVYRIIPKDVVITMMGTTGKSKVIPTEIQDGIIDSHLIRIRANEALADPYYIANLINNSNYILSQIKQNSKGSIMEGLNSSIIKSLLIACPPVDEQKDITLNLDRATGHIGELIKKEHHSIECLSEYRTALISNAVTGKIDVREG